jgi:uncharacterized protein YbaP (TraB family)
MPGKNPLVYRFRSLPAVLILVVCAIASVHAQSPAIQPTQNPLLWRIEGPVPSYLYGTIHIPDQRVLTLPEVVKKAIAVSDALYTEIPFDAGSVKSAVDASQLPQSKDLRTIVGDDVFSRFVKVFVGALGSNVPPTAAQFMTPMLARMTPLAATTQLALLDYLPDLLAGRMPLDLMLYNDAVQAGKETGGIETLEEQTAVLDSVSMEDQTKLLVAALDEIEHPKPGEENPIRRLVALYLAGDLAPLASELNKQDPEHEILGKQFQTRLLDDRNVKMADRIAARCRENKTRSYFFAVGAAHYAGETGIVNQLTKKGFKVTRLKSADAPSIARKPAA